MKHLRVYHVLDLEKEIELSIKRGRRQGRRVTKRVKKRIRELRTLDGLYDGDKHKAYIFLSNIARRKHQSEDDIIHDWFTTIIEETLHHTFDSENLDEKTEHKGMLMLSRNWPEPC